MKQTDKNELKMKVVSINFEQFHRVLPQYDQLVPKVSVEVKVDSSEITLFGNVKMSKEEYINNAGNLAEYILDKYFS